MAADGFSHMSWLRSLPGDGPFLSLPVLDAVFPHGLVPTDAEDRRAFDRAYAAHRHGPDSARAATAEAFVRTTVVDVLGWHECARFGQEAARWGHTSTVHGADTTPAFALVDPADDDGVPQMLGFLWPAGTDLAARSRGSWPASPIDRAAIVLRHRQVPLALLSNGRQFAVVWAERGTATGHVVFDTHAMLDDRLLLDAFTTLLSRGRFLGVAADDTLHGLLSRSLAQQEAVTENLSVQVRAAVEILVDAFSAANRADPDALAGVGTDDVYQAAVAVVMRLVFLLAAEERRLLPGDDALYASAYGIADLAQSLIGRANDSGEEVLALRSSAFPQILATSRVLYEGVRHPALNIKGYGGSVFDPDAYPWLEGRQPGGPGRPIAVDDRTMLHILRGLTMWQGRRLVYRTLDVEQMGYAYEGLLDHTAVMAESPVLGLSGPREPEVTLDDVEQAAARGEQQFDKWLKDLRGKARTRTEKAFTAEAMTAEQRRLLVAACGGDEHLADRIAGFGVLLRTDGRTGEPVVFLPGTVFVTASSARGDSGAHYTPRVLAEDVVKTTLDAVVYDPGPIDTDNADQWRLVGPDRLLELNVADIAMGSGAFLVAADRYLADLLLQSVAAADPTDLTDPELVRLRRVLDAPTPEGAAVSADDDEAVLAARRLVATRCLYGVDINPMAVEMAKLSLWLVTAAKDQPFGFLDHHLVAGDSLLGLHSGRQLEELDLHPDDGGVPRQLRVYQDAARETLVRVRELRRQISRHRTPDRRAVEEQQRLYEEAQALSADLSLTADALVGGSLAAAAGRRDRQLAANTATVAGLAGDLFSGADTVRQSDARQAMAAHAHEWLDHDRPGGAFVRDPVHWPLVFPEVFSEPHPGFDAIIGNPPFLGGKKISGPLGSAFREHLVSDQGRGVKGNADLVAYMLLQAARLVRADRGEVGVLATNTLAQGDTREVGLDQLARDGWAIRAAVKSRPWPGTASLEYARVHLSRRQLTTPAAAPTLGGQALRRADGSPGQLTSALDPAGRASGSPFRLVANRDMAFQGAIVLGLGFTMPPHEAASMISDDPRNADVLFPYLNGQDLNSSPTQSASRWVVNFFDWDEAKARTYAAPFAKVERDVKPERASKDAVKYPKMVELWWRYWNERTELQSLTAKLDTVIAVARVSNVVQPTRVSARQVASDATVVVATESTAVLGLLSSAIHGEWVRKYASSLETRVRYTPSDVFETFPLPDGLADVGPAGSATEAARNAVMQGRGIGLTDTYKLVNQPACDDPDVEALRQAHRNLDRDVLSAYGWDDIDPDHGHYDTAQGVRYTISPAARDEILDRLLELNHQRHADEVAAGIATPKGTPARTAGKRGRKKATTDTGAAPGTVAAQSTLFGDEDDT